MIVSGFGERVLRKDVAGRPPRVGNCVYVRVGEIIGGGDLRLSRLRSLYRQRF